jgi:hypothetical protein
MGSWYWIGVSAGLGAGIGILLAGVVGAMRAALVAAGFAAFAAGAGLGYGIDTWFGGGWPDVVAGAVAGLLVSLGAVPIVAGALRRGGTRAAVATLVGGAALIVAGLAWIPVFGFLEVLVVVVLAVRLRRTTPERYAGLRTLARD